MPEDWLETGEPADWCGPKDRALWESRGVLTIGEMAVRMGTTPYNLFLSMHVEKKPKKKDSRTEADVTGGVS